MLEPGAFNAEFNGFTMVSPGAFNAGFDGFNLYHPTCRKFVPSAPASQKGLTKYDLPRHPTRHVIPRSSNPGFWSYSSEQYLPGPLPAMSSVAC